ncbi:MAG: NAD-dependent epimerase/dehydratase family protein [Bdellovibrionales bacterium]|nr:NAD-dependent epimerase/dehydratase family protein [Bdellovibrionales bacterium]
MPLNPFLPNTGFWNGKKVLVTGGRGFLGRHLCERLTHFGADLRTPTKAEYDLTVLENALACFDKHRPDIVIHSAAYYGGLGITLAEAGTIYYQNLVMGANVMEAARRFQPEKFITVGTACSYPGNLENHLKEQDLWSGELHSSVIGYGSVKKMLAIQGIVYKRQFGLNSIHLIPSNLYGPFDCYDDYRSHVVAALIKKFCDAHLEGKDVSCWGTGAPIREFLFVEDCADGILLAGEKYNDTTPLNIGTGVGISIKELAETIATCLGFQGKIHWDSSKPDGQKVKQLDISNMVAALNWKPRTALVDGVRASIKWYLESLGQAAELTRRDQLAA